MTVQNEPIVQTPFLYINGIIASVASNTTLSISAGQCRDSNDIMDIGLGSSNPNIQGVVTAAPLVLNAAVNGANGLDTGTFLASKVYAVYVIADSRYYQPVASLLSLSLTAPLMPFGYDSMRLIGYAITDSSVHFLTNYVSGNNNARSVVYDAPQATSVTAGTSATYAAIDLSALVPAVDQTPVMFRANWTANAAADTFNMQGGYSTGDAWTMIAPVAGGTAHTVGFGRVLSQLVSSVPKSNYKVSAVGGVAINVAGFEFFV